MTGAARILTVDIGSSSVRTGLYDETLRRLPATDAMLRPYRWRMAGGAMEIDAGALFAEAVAAIDAGTAAAAAERAEIAAVAVTTFWHGLVGIDGGGAAVTPLYGWGDSRAASATPRLRGLLDPERYHQRTGCFLHASYPAAKIAWVRSEDPVAFERVAAWASFGELLEARFFGSRRCSLSIASGSGLFDAGSLRWDAETLAALGVRPEQLPPLVDIEPRRGLLPDWAARWPMLADVAWFPAVGDGACANLGAGGIGRELPGLTIGTSAAARVVWEREPDEPIPDDLWCYLLDARHRVAGGALSNGGNGLTFLLERFPELDPATLNATLRTATPGAHGLVAIPSLVAERGLGWTEIESGALIGLRADTTSLAIATAWLEAIAQRLAELIERLERHFGRAAEVRASGGALRVLPGWAQTIADASGVAVRGSGEPEATSRGAALLAARALGWIDSLATDGPPPGELAEPRPGLCAAHRHALERQHELARAIRAASSPRPRT